MKTVVVLPTYNERENIQKLIPRIFNVFRDNGVEGNLIVVDDNSPDGTFEVVDELGKEYPITLIERESKLGIGSAYIAGFKKALEDEADLIFEMDADLSHDPNYIPEFIEKIGEGFEVVVGSRRIKGGKVVGWNWYRKMISWGGNIIGKYIAGVNVDDLTSGYRVYTREVLDRIYLDKVESDGYGFQLEMLARSAYEGFNIGVIPIVFNDRHSGTSKLSRIEVINFFIMALKIRIGLLR